MCIQIRKRKSENQFFAFCRLCIHFPAFRLRRASQFKNRDIMWLDIRLYLVDLRSSGKRPVNQSDFKSSTSVLFPFASNDASVGSSTFLQYWRILCIAWKTQLWRLLFQVLDKWRSKFNRNANNMCSRSSHHSTRPCGDLFFKYYQRSLWWKIWKQVCF